MNDDVIRSILRRLAALEASAPRLRVGEVTGVGPLDVDLGGSGVPFEDVACLGPEGPGGLDVGDVVATLARANDLLVLGKIGAGGIRFGTGTLTWPGATPFTNTLSLDHDLGTTPVAAVATAILPAGGTPCVVHYVTLGATDIEWRGYDATGASPAGGSTKAFLWAAFA